MFQGVQQADATYGRRYTWTFQGKIWAEVVQMQTAPTNMESTNTYASEFKVLVQAPAEVYDCATTRFVYTRRGRTFCLQPYKIEINCGQRIERAMYRCKQVSMIDTGEY